MLDTSAVIDILVRLAAATILGGLVGLERQLHGHWAGLRTHMMVALGTAVFVVAGLELGPPEAARVIQGIAAGIGFLGAGTILKISDRLEVIGLTTASSIWLAAAVGSAAGLRLFALATIGTLISLVVLAVIRPLEKRFPRKDEGQSTQR